MTAALGEVLIQGRETFSSVLLLFYSSELWMKFWPERVCTGQTEPYFLFAVFHEDTVSEALQSQRQQAPLSLSTRIELKKKKKVVWNTQAAPIDLMEWANHFWALACLADCIFPCFSILIGFFRAALSWTKQAQGFGNPIWKRFC